MSYWLQKSEIFIPKFGSWTFFVFLEPAPQIKPHSIRVAQSQKIFVVVEDTQLKLITKLMMLPFNKMIGV